MLTLAELVAPTDEATFFERCWGREPHLSRGGDAARSAALFTLDDLDALLQRVGRPGLHGMRVGGRAGDGAGFVAGDRPVHLDDLRAAFERGQTLFINGMAERDERFRALGAALFSSFRCPVSINLMFTPPASQSYPPHFETHDVFALQLAGEKRWKLSAPTVIAPLPHVHREHIVAREALGEPMLDVVLQPGDVLYFPRGFVHDVSTGDRLSLHASIGIHAPSVCDLLVDLVRARAFDDPRLRRTPRTAELLGDGEALARELLGAIPSLQAASFGELAEHLATRGLLSELSLPGARFAALDTHIEADTPLRKRPHAVCRVTVADGRASIVFQGKEVRGPGKLGRAFAHIASCSGAFRPRDLPALTENEQLIVCRRLGREGLLVALGAEQPPRAG